MADINQNKAEQYRKERKARLAKAAKKNAKNIEKKTAARSLIKKVVAIVLAAAIGLSCLYGILNYTGVIYSTLKIGGCGEQKISMSEYKYYYMRVFENFYQNELSNSYNGGGSSTGYDISLTPEEQTSKAVDTNGNQLDMTWSEYFRQETLNAIQQLFAYYQEAQKEGITLTDEELKSIDEQIEALRETADSQGKSGTDDNAKGYSLNAYLRLQYGNGVTESFIRKHTEMELLANKYAEEKVKSMKKDVDSKRVDEIFNKDPDSYQYVDLRCYFFEIEALTQKEDEKEDAFKKRQETADKKVKENADKMLKEVKDEKSFIAYAEKLNIKEDPEYDADRSTKIQSFMKSSVQSNFGDELAEWAFKNETKNGDKKMVELKDSSDNVIGYAIALMVNTKHDENTVSVRHILFPTTTTNEEGKSVPLSDAEIKKAKANADKALADWKTDGKSETKFAQLASELSSDSSKDNGGLYENVAPGQMVPEFDKWIFDSKRKEGDCEIVKTEFGYHIIYFVSNNGSYKDNTIREILAQEDFSKKADELLKTTYVVGVGPRRTDFIQKKTNKIVEKTVQNYNKQMSSYGY